MEITITLTKEEVKKHLMQGIYENDGFELSQEKTEIIITENGIMLKEKGEEKNESGNI